MVPLVLGEAKLLFLRGQVPQDRDPKQIMFNNIEECDDVWTQLCYGMINRIGKGGQLSEVDGMAVTAILSTQILVDQFINHTSALSKPEPNNLKIVTQPVFN